MVLALYKYLTTRLSPLLRYYLKRRLAKGKEDPARLYERFGGASLARPKGSLIWIHAASVGESLSVLKLLDSIKQYRPDISILMTSGTVTSARLLQRLLPKGCIHQYIPLDVPKWVNRFINHWQPDVAIILESEFWPNLLQTCHEKKVPLLLLNARLSDKSFQRWSLFKPTASHILKLFTHCFTPSKLTASRLSHLGAQSVSMTVNLKFFSDTLGFCEQELAEIRKQIHNRPIWAAVSTHKGEEEAIIETHKLLQKSYPNLLTVLAPRHPERRDEIRKMLESANLKACWRSKHDVMDENTDVYVVDTIGDLGLVYSLCKIVFIGGSLVSIGGHNPIEAIKLGCAVIMGPYIYNFVDVKEVLGESLLSISTSQELAKTVTSFLEDKNLLEATCQQGFNLVTQQQAGLDQLTQEICGYLKK